MPYKMNIHTGKLDRVGSSGGGGSGDVVGPASAVDGNLVAFDGTTGKLVKDLGIKLTVGTTEPTSPNTNDLWVDTN